MAKRYFRFEELTEKAGQFKPGGTMGSHHCMIVVQGESLVVVGSAEGRVTLKPGDTLGYDCGSVWVVPKPDSYRDPIRRVLALAKIGQRLLVISDEPVSVSHNGRVDVFGPCRQGDFSRENGIDNNCSYDDPPIEGGKCVVVRGRRIGCSTDYLVVERVVVRPSANKTEVAEWLGGFFDVGAARERRLEKERLRQEAFDDDAASGRRIFEQIAALYDAAKITSVLAEHATFKPGEVELEEVAARVNAIHTWWSYDYQCCYPGLRKAPPEAYERFQLGICWVPLENARSRFSQEGWFVEETTHGYRPQCILSWGLSLNYSMAGEDAILVDLFRKGTLQRWLEQVQQP